MRNITGLGPEDSGTVFELEERDLTVIESVKKLPEKYRIVVHLFYYEDMSVDDISNTIGVKPSTVRTRLTRARDMLRRRLEER